MTSYKIIFTRYFYQPSKKNVEIIVCIETNFIEHFFFIFFFLYSGCLAVRFNRKCKPTNFMYQKSTYTQYTIHMHILLDLLSSYTHIFNCTTSKQVTIAVASSHWPSIENFKSMYTFKSLWFCVFTQIYFNISFMVPATCILYK